MTVKLYHIVLPVLLLLLVGCQAEKQADEIAWVNGTLDESASGSMMPFTVQVEQAGAPVGIDFRGALVSGTLRVQLIDADGESVWQE